MTRLGMQVTWSCFIESSPAISASNKHRLITSQKESSNPTMGLNLLNVSENQKIIVAPLTPSKCGSRTSGRVCLPGAFVEWRFPIYLPRVREQRTQTLKQTIRLSSIPVGFAGVTQVSLALRYHNRGHTYQFIHNMTCSFNLSQKKGVNGGRSHWGLIGNGVTQSPTRLPQFSVPSWSSCTVVARWRFLMCACVSKGDNEESTATLRVVQCRDLANLGCVCRRWRSSVNHWWLSPSHKSAKTSPRHLVADDCLDAKGPCLDWIWAVVRCL